MPTILGPYNLSDFAFAVLTALFCCFGGMLIGTVKRIQYRKPINPVLISPVFIVVLLVIAFITTRVAATVRQSPEWHSLAVMSIILDVIFWFMGRRTADDTGESWARRK